MCDDARRRTIDSYESEFINRCKEQARRKKPVSKDLQDFVHWMFTDLRGLEKTLAIPAVKAAVELSGQIEKLQDQIEDLRRDVNRMDNKLPASHDFDD